MQETQTMKSVKYQNYGTFEGLSLVEVAMPALEDDEVLVCVAATGLHVGDCFGVRGAPFAMRVVSGLFRPKVGVPGYDVAGRVERVGSKVTHFKPGDEVFGFTASGGCCEFARVKEGELAFKPVGLSFEESAALPTSALAALHALRDAADVQPGQKVLINGASGGVGSFAIQIAKAFGAEVTGVCSTSNVEMVRSLGADGVVDYTKEDFTEREGYYDLIFDNVENRSLADVRRALAADGTLVLNSGTGAQGFAMFVRLVKPIALSPFVGHSLKRYLSTPNREDLDVLKELVEAGKLKPVIDRSYPLGETAHALEYIEQGHARGKVVIQSV